MKKWKYRFIFVTYPCIVLQFANNIDNHLTSFMHKRKKYPIYLTYLILFFFFYNVKNFMQEIY